MCVCLGVFVCVYIGSLVNDSITVAFNVQAK